MARGRAAASKRIAKMQCDSMGTDVLIYDEHRDLMLWLHSTDTGVEGEVARDLIRIYSLKPLDKRWIYAEIDAANMLHVWDGAPEQEW